MKSFLFGFVSAIALFVAIGAFIIYTGRAPLSAAEAQTPFLDWLFHTSYEQAVKLRAAGIQAPAPDESQPQLFRGARSFDAMCRGCHLPPGAEETPFSKGLKPAPPELKHIMRDRTPAEAFWVLQNGVHFTAMPAMGLTHDDEELWALVDFLQRAKTMEAQDYQRIVDLAKAQAPEGDGHQHSH